MLFMPSDPLVFPRIPSDSLKYHRVP
jgi:hypothetical protein